MRPDAQLELRLHRALFTQDVSRAEEWLLAWLDAALRERSLDAETRAAFRAWLDEGLREHPRPPRPARIDLRSRTHDLRVLADEVLADSFAEVFGRERPAPLVSWGRRTPSRSRRSLRLGSYDARRDLVRIHPVLDDERVPAWFVRAILFHEFLHAELPTQRDASGRLRHHTPEFRAREEAYPDHERAREWERRNIGMLIRSARRGCALGT